MISLSSQSHVLVSQRYLGASGPVTLAMIHCPNHQYIIAMVPSQPSLLYVVQAGSDVFQTELFHFQLETPVATLVWPLPTLLDRDAVFFHQS